jgi:hypothetical protein
MRALIDRFGNIDPTDGGKTSRYSVSGNAWSGDTRFFGLRDRLLA